MLASPEAAHSKGMEMEARHWFSRNREGQVLIIVTAGECETWEDIRHHLLPSAIRSKLATEPLWIPLQHRRADILANPNSHAVRGQLIEDLRQVLLCLYPGRDWGQLRGEERSQRRRALGLMSAATVLFLVLAVAALGFAWYAQLQRLLAESRQLSAQSALLQSQSPAFLPRSILLAVESVGKNPNLEANQALRYGIPLLAKPAFSIPYQGSVEHMALSSTGVYLATAGYLEKQVHLWTVSDRKPVATLPHDKPIQSLVFSPDGRFLVVAGLSGTVLHVWNVATAKEAGQLDCHSEVHALAFSRNGRYLATGQNDHKVRIWRISVEDKVDAKQVAVLDHKDEVFGVTFSDDDQYLATSFLNMVALWKLSGQNREINARRLGDVEAEVAVNSVAISPDGKYLATGLCCNKPFKLWDLASRDLVATMPDEGAESVIFSPDSKYVAAVSRDSTSGIWEVKTQREVNRIESRSSRVAFGPNGKYFVSKTEDAIVFWEWSNNDPITATFTPGSFAKFSSSVDGRALVLADVHEAVASFDIYSHSPALQIKLGANERSLSLSNYGTYLATAREDNAVLVWSLTGQPEVIAMMKGDKEEQNKGKGDVGSGLFSPDGRYLVIRKKDGTLLFWDPVKGEVTRGAFPDPEIYSIQLSGDGRRLISASGRVRGRRSSQEKHYSQDLGGGDGPNHEYD